MDNKPSQLASNMNINTKNFVPSHANQNGSQKAINNQSNTNISVRNRKGAQRNLKKKYIQEKSSATHLLGFIEEKEPQIIRAPRKTGKRDGYSKMSQKNYNVQFDKEKFVQASMKFVLKNPKQDGGCALTEDSQSPISQKQAPEGESEDLYLVNLLDSNEKVNWRDVVQVQHEMVNSKDITCPICMEALEDMVCPRITKCGHIYCWPCVLQYLDFEKDYNWKRCPLCFDPVYQLDLKNVVIRQNKYYKAGNIMKFDLMVRSKGSSIAKNKHLESLQLARVQTLSSQDTLSADEKSFIDHVKQSENMLEFSGFTQASIKSTEDEIALYDKYLPYQNNKIHLNNKEYYSQLIAEDLERLEKDFKYKMSCGEEGLLPYVQQAIKQLRVQQKNLAKVQNSSKLKLKKEPSTNSESYAKLGDKYVPIQKLNEQAKKVEGHKENTKIVNGRVQENNTDFFYFYQCSTGENLFLHSVSYKLLHQQFNQDYKLYPTQIQAKVEDIEYDILSIQSMERHRKQFKQLDFLPDNTPFGTVEIDAKDLLQSKQISKKVYDENLKQIQSRKKQRRIKYQGEEIYNKEKQKLQDQQFEDYKQKAISSIGGFVGGKGYGVIKNPAAKEEEQEPEEESGEELPDSSPIDIENYTLEEEKERDTIMSKNMAKRNDVWKNLEKTLGQDDGIGGPIASEKKHSNDYSWRGNSGPLDFEPLPPKQKKPEENIDTREFSITTAKRKGKKKKMQIISS